MSWALDVANTVVRSVYKLYFNLDQKCHLFRLPPDIFVDGIFQYLLIDELLNVRKTNKVLYLLTHEPIIWKRYLRRLRIPVVQLRPTFKFTEPISNHEVEYLVTRACAVDRAWRRGFPMIQELRVLSTQYKIIDLKLLPGGKFLVASAKDRGNYRFYILVYALDVMYGSRLLARLPTYFKVYDIQAQYMDHNNQPGIMISYIRRRFEHGPPTFEPQVPDSMFPGVPMFEDDAMQLDISDYAHNTPVDFMHPLIYDACCVHMRLDPVEELIRPDMSPMNPQARSQYLGVSRSLEPPFRDVLRHESPAEIHSTSLFLYRETPCMGFAVGNQLINIIQLSDLRKVTMQFRDYPGYEMLPHRIRSFRFLPCQDGILLIRSVSTAPGLLDTHVFEVFDIPQEPGLHFVDAKYGWECEDKWHLDSEFVIADPANPARKMGPDHPDILRKEYCPPTLWAFAPSENPKGAAYWYFRPQPEKDYAFGPKDKFVYKDVDPRVFHHQDRKYHERALPGSERTLLYVIDRNNSDSPPLIKLRRFFWPEDRFPALYPTEDICHPVMNVHKDDRDSDFVFTDIVRSDALADEVNRDGGLTAITWDESSGRICLVSAGSEEICIFDLAPVLEPHHRLAYQWRTKLIDPTP